MPRCRSSRVSQQQVVATPARPCLNVTGAEATLPQGLQPQMARAGPLRVGGHMGKQSSSTRPPSAAVLFLAGLLLVPEPAWAGSRTALGVVAGAVLGAAVLGAMAKSQAGVPRSSGTRKTAKKKSAPKQDSGTASAANDDPFAGPAGEARPVSSRP